MNKITVEQSLYPIQLPGQEGHLLKIWTSDEEPPKSYIWECDGERFVWYCNNWIPVELFLKYPYFDCGCDEPDAPQESVFEKFKKDIINQVSNYISNYSGNTQDLKNRVIELEKIDHSKFAEKTEVDEEIGALREEIGENLGTRLTNLENDNLTNLQNISALNDRVTNLENNSQVLDELSGIEDRVSDLESNISDLQASNSDLEDRVADSETNISNLSTELSELKQTSEDNALTTSAALNDLNDRMLTLEEIDHSKFITAKDI